MTTITGSFTNANPGPTLYALIETIMLADGWTLEATVVIGGNTHKVLKSAATGNARGLDWFLDINFPTTGVTGGMRFAPFEGFTVGTNVGLRGPFGGTNLTTIDAATHSRYGAATSALETNWMNQVGNSGVSMTLATIATGYIVSVTRNRIIVNTTNSATFAYYAGFFTPSAAHIAHAGAALFPLIMCAAAVGVSPVSSSSASAVTAAVTRLPKLTSMSANPNVTSWADYLTVANTPGGSALRMGGRPGVPSDFTGQSSIAPLAVLFGSANISTNTPAVTYVGDLDGLANGYTPTSTARGDTVTDGTDTWHALAPSTYFGLFIEGV